MIPLTGSVASTRRDSGELVGEALCELLTTFDGFYVRTPLLMFFRHQVRFIVQQ